MLQGPGQAASNKQESEEKFADSVGDAKQKNQKAMAAEAKTKTETRIETDSCTKWAH